MRGVTLLLALLLLGAGCIGGGGEDDDGIEPTDQDPPADPSTGDGSEANMTTFQTTTEEGTITGVNTPAGSGSLGPASENQAFSFQVPADTQVAYLNLTASGGELQMNVADPSCEVSPTATCENTTTTSNGEATVELEAPDSGAWNVRFFVAEPVGQVDYTLEITLGVLEPA